MHGVGGSQAYGRRVRIRVELGKERIELDLSRCHRLRRSGQLFQFRRALQPVRHVHLAVHRRRGCEVSVGLLALARAQVGLGPATPARDLHHYFARTRLRIALRSARLLCAASVFAPTHTPLVPQASITVLMASALKSVRPLLRSTGTPASSTSKAPGGPCGRPAGRHPPPGAPVVAQERVRLLT
jgi:hypothetical protein